MKKIYTPDFIQKDSISNQGKVLRFSFVFLFTLFLSFTAFSQTTIINATTDGAFEGASFAADGWTVKNNDLSGASWVQSTGATAGFTGTKCAYITSDVTATPPPHTYMNNATRVSSLYRDVTVPVEDPIITLSFKWIGVGEIGNDRLQVWAVPTSFEPLNGITGITTDGFAPSGRILLGTYSGAASWTNASISLPGDYAGETFRLVFQWRNDFSNVSNPPIAIDSVSLISNCIGAVAGEATAITSTSATANWYALDDATSYDLRYRSYVAGAFTAWTSMTNLMGTSVSLTSLSPSFYYEYQVKGNGTGICTYYSQTISFLALCNAEIAPTVVQDFSSYTTTAPNPICWSEARGEVASSSVLTGTESNWTGAIFANSGSNKGAKINLNAVSNGEWLISQSIDLGITSGLYRVKYDLAVTSAGGTTVQTTLATHAIKIIVSTDGGTTWSSSNVIKTYTGAGTYSNIGQSEIINLIGYSGIVKIAFVATTIQVTPAVDFFIDNFIVEAIPVLAPNCATGHIPADLVTGIVRNSTLSWTAATGSPTSYDVYFGTTSNPSFVVNQTGLSYTPPTMDGNKTYYWKIQPKNQYGAALCTTQSFTTGNTFNYCTVSTTNAGDYSSAFSTTLATSNINYTATIQPSGSYSNQTIQDFKVGQGTVFNFSHTYVGGGNGMKIWIDYNNNGVFEALEEVFYLANSSLTKTGSVAVPLSTPIGIYRMRVRSVNGNSGNPTACGNLNYGSTVDYALNVIAAPSCFAPKELNACYLTTNSATLSWTPSIVAPSNGYDYYYATTNIAPEAVTIPNGTVGAGITSANIATLSTNTVYYFWIRGNCGGGDTSTWTASGTFKTAAFAVASLSENFDSVAIGTTFPDRWTRVVIGTPSLSISSTTPASAPNNVLINGSATNKSMIVLPEFSNINAGTHWLKLKVRSITAGGTLKFGYLNCDPRIENFTVLQTITVPNTTYTNSEQAFQVPTSVPSTARLAILNDGTSTNNFYIDDVIWQEIPLCSVPTNAVVEILSSTSAKLTWTASSSNPSGGYLWEVRSSGAAGSGAVGFVSSNSVAAGLTTATVTGLSVETNYSFYVRSNCQYNNLSNWSGPVVFSTCPTGVWVGTTSDWNTASNWADNRVPGACTNVTVNVSNPIAISGDAKVATITLGAAAVLAINGSLEVGNITVATGGQFTIANNAVLLQSVGATNSGTGTVKRNSTSLFRQDYTLWSSPVFEPNLRNFSPETLFNRFYSYDFSTTVGGAYKQEIFTAEDVTNKKFGSGKGYLIRMPNNANVVGGTAQSFEGIFKGILNNDEIQIPLYGVVPSISSGFNLVGNPYPSPIKISEFMSQNNGKITGVMYFWRKKASANDTNNTISGYTTLNGSGMTSADPEINLQSLTHIKPGQGFFVQAIGTSPGNLVFKNSMREKEPTGGIFFKSPTEHTSTNEMHRFWLNLSNDTDVVGQTLVAYTTGATQGVDNEYDAVYFNDSPLALTSIINNNEYIIQGRALPFLTTDSVPLGFKANVAGSYTIALANFEGIFADNQDIFLKDKTTNTIQNLKIAPYVFNSTVGVFNERFEVQYTGTLGAENPSLDINSILIGVKDQQIIINAGSVIMEKIELIDLTGRVIYSVEGISTPKVMIKNVVATNQMLVVRISTKEKGVVNKKIIF